MISIPLIVCATGLIVNFINSRREKPDSVLEMASRYAYILGLAFTLAGVVGKSAL